MSTQDEAREENKYGKILPKTSLSSLGVNGQVAIQRTNSTMREGSVCDSCMVGFDHCYELVTNKCFPFFHFLNGRSHYSSNFFSIGAYWVCVSLEVEEVIFLLLISH